MKFSKKIISVTFAALISSSAFAIDGFMHDAFIWIKSNVKDFSETAIRQNIADGRLVNPSPLDLKAGDIFIDINGHAKQVKKITKVGNNITIEADKPEIYNVFDAINIPDQTADFKAAIDEKFANSNNDTVSEERNSDNNDKNTKKLLDALMPSPDHKIPITITLRQKRVDDLPLSDLEKKIKNLENTAAEKTTSEKDKKNLKNEAKMLGQKVKGANVSGGVKIPLELRYTSRKNELGHGLTYARAGIDTHGTWKFWKWTTWYKPGHANFTWDEDSEIGFSAGIQGFFNGNVSLPFMTLGNNALGVYLTGAVQLNAYGSIGYEFQYYLRTMTAVKAASDIDFLFIPSNIYTSDKEWRPSIMQHDVFLAGDFSIGPVFKAGVVLLGLSLAELSAPGGFNLSGTVGGQEISKSMDEENNFNDIKESINGKKYDEIEEGLFFLADAKAILFFKINLNLFNGVVSTTLFDFSKPLWIYRSEFASTPGFTSPFGNWSDSD